ncbi:1-deoxy-D-xylulose 5-phosphate synthase [hydrothermal vent metagenome]|uniref:1-deoxy-D-xylulose-5-phosphate synthase n=1 Tax=hydrothermal vent metagenome TaxID=652676 RepID=A0A3B1BSS0_9ZZZZ
MPEASDFPLLQQIDDPVSLRKLSLPELKTLSTELRQFLIQSVSKTGGHLAAGLGTVELTIALHYVYDTPEDRLVWDVGHQSYPHKILTGRRERMPDLRVKNGLRGFPSRNESEYDAFGVGHSSTSISAALGMALAAARTGSPRRAVAIIGDGALSAGMAFEALNHAGDLDANLLVILNDNDMSISANVGGLSNHLARMLSGRLYSTMREGSKKVLGAMPSVWELARRAEEHVKGMVVPGTLFEELGFNYIGPIDGHDLDTLVKTLENLKHLKGPQFLHVVTTKGKGYQPAEDNPCAYHGVGRFDPDSGDLEQKPGSTPTYTKVFSDWLCDMAKQDDRLVAITPAMREGSGLVDFSKQFPRRYFDVGIAEQHAVTLAAGMACDGLKPVVAIYSTFLQRAYDQLIHDVALQNLPVLFAIDRAGVVGPDGPTHAGSFDLSYLRAIPNLTIMAPADENECRQMLYTGFQHDGPAAVRYPRGRGPGTAISQKMTALPLGKGKIVRKGSRIALLVFGTPLAEALIAAEQLGASVANMRFIKPLDSTLVLELANSHDLLVTIEDNVIMGGAGSAVNECLMTQQVSISVLNMGLPDIFMEQASREQLLADADLSSSGIIHRIEHFIEDHPLAKHSTVA